MRKWRRKKEEEEVEEEEEKRWMAGEEGLVKYHNG